ncbi:hypothetical protein A3C59_04100 [Candidatus Daviesbacteria bacterium RIFCSPHIGHO2_02_FULL_36_13]|uniref:Solute-binding protein family 5 domain-containing protein n=1 Tax=Candidatus Daviesbacteria bacterium RIFCSPHIGHO2_02_FULL_36_13 TaxID=1797768 RepID=A0A1F5JRV4_9BACT|nr:MAG: hypothetical protein A3C59_04100 [Candidatus Daviesbacteria bacterium RIFCSPHIGHO2_02_FULL_36_13]
MKLFFLVSFEIIKRSKGLLFLILVILGLIIFVQVKFNLLFNSNTITLGFIGTYQTHDLPLEVTNLISEGLVIADENGRIKPNLVSGWETNNDATVFKFKLKDDLKWVDGTPIKSSDLVLSIPNVEISTPDDKTIQFKLSEAYSPFPSLLTKPIIKKGEMIGMGPYKISKIEKSRIFITKIELTTNDSSLPKIYIRFYPNEKVAITGFNLGEVQTLFDFSDDDAFSQNSNVKILKKTDFKRIVTVLFSMSDSLVGSKNRSLRQALSYITPKIEGEELANNPYPSNHWAYDSGAKKYLDNKKEAEEALERAKSQMSADQLKGEIILTSTLNLEEVGKKVVESWRSLGFDAKLRVESGLPQNFQSLLITQSIPQDPDQYFLWHATQTKTNLTKYDSKRADKNLEDGRKAINESDRKEKYFDFQRTLLEDAPAIFLYFPKYNIAYLEKKEALLQKVLSLTK